MKVSDGSKKGESGVYRNPIAVKELLTYPDPSKKSLREVIV